MLGGITALFLISPLQYMAGMTGPVWLVVVVPRAAAHGPRGLTWPPAGPQSAAESLDFASYVAARRPALLRWAWAVAGDPHTAEDLLQASLVRVLPRWESIRRGAAADAYVRRTITRQYVSWHRQPWRRASGRVGRGFPEPAGTCPTPRRPATRTGLWSLVLALPPSSAPRSPCATTRSSSVAETAAVLGCSTGTVKSNTSRGAAPRCAGSTGTTTGRCRRT